MSKRGITKENARELQRLSKVKAGDVKAARVTTAVALHHAGRDVSYIATFLGVTIKTVYRYLGDARRDGRQGNSGRPRKHTARCGICGKLSGSEYPVALGVCSRKRCQKRLEQGGNHEVN